MTDNVPLKKDDEGEKTQELFHRFLEEFLKDRKAVYKILVKELEKPDRNTLKVNFADIQVFSESLASAITNNYYRHYPYLCRALVNFARDHNVSVVRKQLYVAFDDVMPINKLRELKSEKIGTMIRISGQVVRTHPVHPELSKGTFTCANCQTVIRNVEQQFKYTQPIQCTNSACDERKRFTLDIRKSTFVDFQKLRIQEIQSELPRGSIPRSLEVILRGECVEMPQPGDRCDFIGTLIVIPDVGQISVPGAKIESGARHRGQDGYDNSSGVKGLKSLGVRELNYRMAFLACSVLPTTARFGGRYWSNDNESPRTPEWAKQNMTPSEFEKINEMADDRRLYANLIDSLFPAIHGNEDIKKGILLMLFGGVPKRTKEGTTLRGDVNICIVGDPSTAKSQFLKQVEQFSPRAVYTSGKASTAAGLTAAVVKDEESFDFVIEAGALMLADNGVCCIDEFDKMDLRDQVAIHEAMEQQTISITKAGVKATLNAKTSILAAANPIGGRYDLSKSLKHNIALSSPIVSRFDLFFILVDECNEIVDYAIARRILDLHRTGQSSSVAKVYTPEDIQRYITFCRLWNPKLTTEAGEALVTYYKQLRARDASGASMSSWRVTVRQLESMIRLSEAMAKLHCSSEVKLDHVKEAYRLLNKSIIRVEQPDVELGEESAENLPENETFGDSMETDANEIVPDNATTTLNSSQMKSVPTKKKLTYEEYRNMANMLIFYIRNEEQKVAAENYPDTGVRQSELIAWYLNQMEDVMDSEEEMLKRRIMVEKVIDHLVKKDKVLFKLTQTQDESDHVTEEEDPILVVHPNYILEVE